MSLIKERFDRLQRQGRKALVTYITAGDPSPEVTLQLMHALVRSGADLLELGVPFSDPMADGPVIQAACERALVHHVGLRRVIELVREFRREDMTTPVVLMGYLNPIEVMGYEVFAQAAAAAGVDGLLTVDLPPEEAISVLGPIRAQGLDPIFLIAPTSVDARIESICKQAQGFVYYVSLKGVTGATTLDVESVAERVEAIRRHTDLPVGVGFGINDAETAGRVAAVADAVVVGSAVVRLIEAHGSEPERLIEAVAHLIGGMREAIDASSSERATAQPGAGGIR
ncbi:tryptophan synthase subunit alpha [Acidihalobacter yilgarnensis]|uniref:Tryptophan synthase alpha chain n=1 Tax=Acidihalobacter yilgarnensis TaxID=2819280 RepID=A0A1D8IM08_9GAMM|nr:tryptophan synthase subunit alpha [Acidihalobacter yilgarnensis]AOU97489.1 tryptophan synthase subunit alpha [Acidihalobacter yilgarnensis]